MKFTRANKLNGTGLLQTRRLSGKLSNNRDLIIIREQMSVEQKHGHTVNETFNFGLKQQCSIQGNKNDLKSFGSRPISTQSSLRGHDSWQAQCAAYIPIPYCILLTVHPYLLFLYKSMTTLNLSNAAHSAPTRTQVTKLSI